MASSTTPKAVGLWRGLRPSLDWEYIMNWTKAIGIGSAILFAALWAFLIARAVSLFRWAQAYSGGAGSINASNDVSFSGALLASYAVSLLAALALAWFLFRRPRLVFLLPFGLLVFAVIEVLRLQPESPIVLFPTIRPWRPAVISLAAASFAALFHCAPRSGANERNA